MQECQDKCNELEVQFTSDKKDIVTRYNRFKNSSVCGTYRDELNDEQDQLISKRHQMARDLEDERLRRDKADAYNRYEQTLSNHLEKKLPVIIE